MDNNTKKVISIFDEFAESYQEAYMNVDLYSDSFNFFCANIQGKPSEVLELACGPGNVTHYLLQQKPTLSILATDLSEEMLRLAKKNAPSAAFEKMDCREIASLKKQFNGIVGAFCLPYLSAKELDGLLTDARKLLKNKGLLYLSTMVKECYAEVLETNSKGDQLMMYYYSIEGLIEKLENNGFDVVYSDLKKYTDRHEKEVADYMIIAQKNEP